MFGEYIPTYDLKNVNTWFPTEERNKKPDPPPVPAPLPKPDPPIDTKPLTAPNCPGETNKIFVAKDGTFFQIYCEKHNSAEGQTPTAVLRRIPSLSFTECIEACSVEKECLSVDYVGRNKPTPRDSHVLKDCYLFRGPRGMDPEPSQNCATKAMDMAHKIDPPEEDHPDEIQIVCSTECPYANGGIFDSTNGERFHMDCAKRHGTKSLMKKEITNFADCINACGNIVACHSVDFHPASKTCYLGQHHGEPQIQTDGWMSAHSIGCGGGCKR